MILLIQQKRLRRMPRLRSQTMLMKILTTWKNWVCQRWNQGVLFDSIEETGNSEVQLLDRIAFLNVLVSSSYLSSTLHTNLNILFQNDDSISSLVLLSSSMWSSSSPSSLKDLLQKPPSVLHFLDLPHKYFHYPKHFHSNLLLGKESLQPKV